MAITPSFGLRLRWMCTRWKGNFIKFSMEQYFCICSIMYTWVNPRKRGSSTWWEQDSGDEDSDNKEKLGQHFHWTTQEEIQKFGTKQRLQENWQKKAQVGNIWRQEMLEENHDGLHEDISDMCEAQSIRHTNDDIQWRRYSGFSHKGSWSYVKIFETCVKSLKWVRRVSPHKATLMMCGTNEGIVKSRYKPPIIEDCLLSTPRDHSRSKARRPMYKLTSQDTFGSDNIPLIYIYDSYLLVRLIQFYALFLW
jgi:hypothetical protein